MYSDVHAGSISFGMALWRAENTSSGENVEKECKMIKVRVREKSANGSVEEKKQREIRCIVLMAKQSIKQYLMRTVAVYSSYLHCRREIVSVNG